MRHAEATWILPAGLWAELGQFSNKWYCLHSTSKPHTLVASKDHWVSLLRRHTPSMIDLGTLAGLHAHDHQLAAYCPRCDAWRVLPLASYSAQLNTL